MTILRTQAALLFLAGALYGQTPSAALKFEVASVKASPDPAVMMAAGQRPGRGAGIDAARVDLKFMSLSALITMAYKIDADQLSGPDWMNTQRFDILANIPEGATKEQVPEMLQALLAERFKLVVRREPREEAVYALLIGKDGPKLKEASPGDHTAERTFPNGAGGRLMLYIADHGANGWQTYSRLNGSMVFDADRITMPEFAAVLKKQVDLPVVDMTGLPGAYEVLMPVTNGPNGRALGGGGGRAGGAGVIGDAPAQASDPSGVNIFKSVEKLGLALEKHKAAIEHLVVEHVEKTPTDN